jgi:hypothetical protein
MQRRVGGARDIVAIWGAALRTGTAGSQDESPCRAIHKQRPYRDCYGVSVVQLNEGAAAVNCQDLAGYEVGFGQEGYGIGYVFACASAMEGDALDVIFVGALARKLDGAWGDAVDQDFGA